MGFGFHQRLRQGFLGIAASNPMRCAVIDATQTPGQVHADILATVRARLPVS